MLRPFPPLAAPVSVQRFRLWPRHLSLQGLPVGESIILSALALLVLSV